MNKPSTKITKTAIAKFVAGSVVGTGVGFVVKEIIANNTNLPEGRYQQVAVIAGSAVLGMMAKDASKTYVSDKIDGIVDGYAEVKSSIKNVKAEITEETPVPEQ